jgi:hypothetical protein
VAPDNALQPRGLFFELCGATRGALVGDAVSNGIQDYVSAGRVAKTRAVGLAFDMSDLLENPERWRQRAEEVRTIADGMQDPACKRMMLDVAISYEKLAQRAEARRRGKPESKLG